MWIHEHQNWPNFTWNAEALASKLADIRHRQGHLLGRMEGGKKFTMKLQVLSALKRKWKHFLRGWRAKIILTLSLEQALLTCNS